MIWTAGVTQDDLDCLLGRRRVLTSPSVLIEGRTAITAAPRQVGCDPESEQVHWLNGICSKLL